MQRFIALCALLFICGASCLKGEWAEFKQKFNKQYASAEEEAMRMAVFEDNLAFINEHNTKGNTYTLGATQFADMTHEEWVAFLGKPKEHVVTSTSIPLDTMPGSIDWRNSQCVSGVKNQGQCGDTTIMVAIDCAEDDFCAQSTGNPPVVDMSIQQVIDCNKLGNGCKGGPISNTFTYILNNGLEPASVYPYTGKQGTCKYDESKVTEKFTKLIKVTSGDENDLTDKLTTYGPVACGFDASQSTFQLYEGGLYCPSVCSTTTLDHEMLLVGYTQDDTNNYWILQNSWGTGWGIAGYMELCRGKNECGVATSAECFQI